MGIHIATENLLGGCSRRVWKWQHFGVCYTSVAQFSKRDCIYRLCCSNSSFVGFRDFTVCKSPEIYNITSIVRQWACGLASNVWLQKLWLEPICKLNWELDPVILIFILMFVSFFTQLFLMTGFYLAPRLNIWNFYMLGVVIILENTVNSSSKHLSFVFCFVSCSIRVLIQ